MFVYQRQVNEVLGEATEEDIVEKEYVRQEVDAVATAVAVEVLRYYTDKKRIHEIKKVRLFYHRCVLGGCGTAVSVPHCSFLRCPSKF